MASIAKAILYTNLFVAVSVSTMLIQTYLLLNKTINWPNVFLLGFATLALYNIHRTRKVEHSLKVDRTERHHWAINNKMWLIVIIAISSMGVGYLSYGKSLRFFLLLSPAAIVALGYTFPVLKIGKRMMRLRDLPGIKVSLIAFSVSYLTLILAWENDSLNNLFWLQFFERILFISAITIPFDVRDVEFDRRSHLITIPSVFGIEKSILISRGLLLLTAIFSVVIYSLGERGLFTLVLYLMSLLYAAFIIKYAKPKGSEFFYSFGIEGIMVIQTSLIWLASISQ